jgi:autotransporter translocation and assembly factor TamB
LSPIEIRYGEGSLLGHLTLDALSLNLDRVEVHLLQIELQSTARCLLNSRVCLQQLDVSQIDIELKESGTVKPESSSTSEFLHFPFAVQAENIRIGKADIRWTGGSWSSGAIQAGLNIDASRIYLSNVSVNDSLLVIDPSVEVADVKEQTIQLPTINLPLELVVDDLALRESVWRIGDSIDEHASLELSGIWRGADLALKHARLSRVGWGGVSLSGELKFIDDWPMEMQVEALIERPPFWGGLQERLLQFQLRGELSGLEVGAQTEGTPAYQLQGSVNSLDRTLPFEMKLMSSWDGQISLNDFAQLSSDIPELNLLGPWQLDAMGSLNSQSFTFRGAAAGYGYSELKAELAGEHREGTVVIESARFSDIKSNTAMDMAGRVSFEEKLRWELSVRSTGMQIPTHNEEFSGRVQGGLRTLGEVHQDQWTITLDEIDLEGEINGTPARAIGNLSLNNKLQLGKSELKVFGNGAELMIDARDGLRPYFELQIEDVGRWLPNSHGALSLSSSLEDSERKFVVAGEAKDLTLQGVTIQRSDVRGYFDYSDEPSYDASITLNELEYAGWQLETLRLQLTGRGNDQSLKIDSSGDIETKLRVTGTSAGDTWTGQLHPGSLGTPSGRWILDSAVELSRTGSPAALEVAAHCWRQSDSTVCPADMVLGEEGEIGVAVEADLRFFDSLIPEDFTLDGAIEGNLSTKWTSEVGLMSSGIATVTGGSLTRVLDEDETASVYWDEASVTANIADGIADIRGEISREKSRQLLVSLSLPKESGKEIKGSLVLDKFNLSGVLKPFFPVFSNHTGELTGDVKLSGTAQKPLLDGQLKLVDGQLSVVGNPTAFESINWTIDAVGERVDIVGNMTVGGGETHVKGSLSLHPKPRLEMNIEGVRQTVLLPPGMSATISENLNLVASNAHMDLRGDITVHEGLLEHEQLPQGSIDISSDVVEVDYEGRVVDEKSLIDLSAHLQVNILDSFQVVGTGLETTVGGALELKKESSQPLQLFGELNILEGRIEAFGQRLNVQRGSLSFVGPADNPDLNLRAEREIPDESITVGVEVLGNLDEISFNAYSTPVMSEAETMSYLIRGRGLDKGAEADGAAVALSLGLGAVNRTGLVQGINRIPGVSNVSFGTDGEAGDTTATVGGYLGSRIYLAYGVGVYEPINVLTARLYLQTRLWLEVVSSLQSSVDIYYSFDIE